MRAFATASYLLYFLAGMGITTAGSVLPQLLNHYHLSYTAGGQLVFLGSAGFIIGVPLSAYLSKFLREKTILSAGATLMALSQFGLLVLPPAGFVFCFNFLNGIGAASLETVVATLMMEVFVGRRAVAMSYLEVSFGLGALLAPLIASFFIAQGAWHFIFLATGTVGLSAAIVWRFISFSKEETDESKAMDADTPISPALTSKMAKRLMLILFVFMIFMYTGIEGSLNNFLSSVFIQYLDAVPYFASMSIGVFWVSMVAGRIGTGWIIRKVTYSQYLFWSIAGSLAALVVFILAQNAVAGYGLVIILGLSMSGIYSITMVYANHSLPGLARLVTSLITGFAGLGSAIFPGIVGYTIDQEGMASALWLIVCFAGMYAAALLIILAIHAKANKKVAFQKVANES